MKKYFICLVMILLAYGATAQQFPSQWEVKPDHKLELNYNLMGRHFSQGMFYGAAGYGTGMWLSGNNTWWGLAGSLVSTNIPILFERKMDEPEVVIGRNLGNLLINLSITIPIERHRNKNRYNFGLPTPLQKRY